MTLTEVVVELQKGNLLNDITYPIPRQAVMRAAEYLLDFKDLQLAAEMFLEQPHDDLRRQLLATCLENVKARAAA